MELSIYDIIKKPVVTSKSVELYKKLGQLTFEVDKSANKITIRRAVEKIWDVKVADIRVMNVGGKEKVFARRSFMSPDKKKAIVTLKQGYKIEIPGMLEAVGLTEQNRASSHAVESTEGK
ncbi:MAG: 50S ribosomal protein L23 [Candidatus Babeliales bacterium]|jgi:large subunit ribosomal protein L23